MDTAEQVRRVAALRDEMQRRDLAVFVVPRVDEHQLSHVPAGCERLAWISGFTGSSGVALIGRERAALFVDGRYTLQARAQTSAQTWEYHHLVTAPPETWLGRTLAKGDRVGYDPRLHTPDGLRAMATAAERAGATISPVETNLVDAIWVDRPPLPRAAVELYPEALAGESRMAKRQRMAEALRHSKIDALVISAPDNLAWLLNIRGRDLAVTPLALGFAILGADATVALYMHAEKLGPAVRAAFAAEGAGTITVADPLAFGTALAGLADRRVRVDQTTGSEWIVQKLRAAKATVDLGADPCTLAKACKNPVELAGIRAAHLRDGVAMVRLLQWIEETAPGHETEWTVALRAAALRAEGEHYRGPSFHTIAAVGHSAAHCHYSLREDQARSLEDGAILLVDSGGQYLDGTTDVTRTVILGAPTPEMRRRYTQVLKGHLSLGAARFPADTTGSQLDVLARQHLWSDGVDYDHGTGHGVGCFLSVHEGPHGIAKRPNAIGLRPGMVVSNEPGYYKAGAFGIRIENLIVVKAVEPQPEGAECTTLEFETLTLAPYDRRLIETALLTSTERAAVDGYHARVCAMLSPHLDAGGAAFLAAATAPLES
ncbi:MAG TPA: aminopeptidase P family protein [Kofleriaceae bacterium]|jgi:Xaa-Pro aminopeptidase|nr:aminopeptidase P family protein [Kofleriaceae bacterium]